MKRARLLVGQFRERLLKLCDGGIRQLQRQKIGIGEVTVIVRFFLGAHGARRAGFRIEQARFLVDLAAVLQNVDLAARLVLDGLADEADGVDVLDFAARAERLARFADGDVDVGAKLTLLHIAVAGAEIAHDGAKLRDVGLRFLRRADVRLRHDFHQPHAGAVQIDIGTVRVLVVKALARILLKVQALDAEPRRNSP